MKNSDQRIGFCLTAAPFGPGYLSSYILAQRYKEGKSQGRESALAARTGKSFYRVPLPLKTPITIFFLLPSSDVPSAFESSSIISAGVQIR
jgi:hypothetical protein